MIARYTRPAMGAIWEDRTRYGIWLRIELYACEAQAAEGNVPPEALEEIRAKAAFDMQRIGEIEAEVRHDVIAFLTSVAEHVGSSSRYIHRGMTSSDVLDTCLALQMKQSGELLLADLEALRAVLARRAREFQFTPMVGRTHGVHAEPITFGLKLAVWYDETRRNIERLQAAVRRIAVGQVSGAVGTYEHLSPRIEAYVCGKLGLTPAPVSTQVLQRDRHAEFMTVLAVIGSSLEKMATEIRHLQKTEVLEAEEYFAEGQKGSSAMPHKRNPIGCERIAGLARVLRGNAVAALENVALWHERDITHSSVERIVIPDSCTLLDFMLAEMTGVMDRLLVYPAAMQRNLGRTRGLIFSQSVLLALAAKGMKREDAYRLVQAAAMQVWQSDRDFLTVLQEDTNVTTHLTAGELAEICDLGKSMRHVEEIFRRVGLPENS
jgi:adenylosuccinate lyase